jgi:hypothetical protein
MKSARKAPRSKIGQKGGGCMVNRDVTLQQIAEDIPTGIINASDKELEELQRILQEALKLREGHKNLQKLIQNFTGKSAVSP